MEDLDKIVDRHNLFSQLKRNLINQCPLIYEKIRDDLGQPPYNEIVRQFTDPINTYCSKHSTICIQHSISELACTYQKLKSISLLDLELEMHFKKPGVELLALDSKIRYQITIELGMWTHIKKMAVQIYRAEIIYQRLVGLDPKKLLAPAKEIYERYLCQEETHFQILFEATIKLIEIWELVRLERVNFIIRLLEKYEMPFTFVYDMTFENNHKLGNLEAFIQKWLYGSDPNVFLLEDGIKRIFMKQKYDSKKDRILKQLLSNSLYTKQFLCLDDAILFQKTVEFKVILKY
jgi:hypothetical protein